jgi:hypothetical protein
MSVRALKGEAWYLLMTAATDEAARAGHGEVDVDHVLLGLLVTGGPSTELLARAGLDLAAARAALAEREREESASVPAPRSGHAFGAGTAALPWSDRARRALASLPGAAPDTGMLEAVLADEDGPARRLLGRAGIDADALLGGDRKAVPSAPPAAVGSRRWSSSHTRTVAVPRAQLWQLLADPQRRREWDDSVAQVRLLEDGSFETLDAVAVTLARPGEPVEDPGLVSTHRVVARAEGRLLEWETRYPNRGHTEWLRVELEDAGTGTRLTIRHAFSRTAGLRRLLSGVYAWTTRLRLKLLAQAIAQAASGG